MQAIECYRRLSELAGHFTEHVLAADPDDADQPEIDLYDLAERAGELLAAIPSSWRPAVGDDTVKLSNPLHRWCQAIREIRAADGLDIAMIGARDFADMADASLQTCWAMLNQATRDPEIMAWGNLQREKLLAKLLPGEAAWSSGTASDLCEVFDDECSMRILTALSASEFPMTKEDLVAPTGFELRTIQRRVTNLTRLGLIRPPAGKKYKSIITESGRRAVQNWRRFLTEKGVDN